jgi:putative glutamine amidotransferase
MNRKPTILISPSTQNQGAEFADASISLSHRYPQAIVAAGGVPWILPCIPDRSLIVEAVQRCQGVVLTGGDDVQPRLYADKLAPRLGKTVVAVSPERDLFELLLIQETFQQQKPMFAICRGQQLLNVALGGNLIVDIPTELPHALAHNRQDQKANPVHEVTLTPDSLLAKISGKGTLRVNSTHHQAVNQVADSLRVTAASQDGVIEALELRPEAKALSPFLVSVQFHPERLFDRYQEFLDLFRSFIRASIRSASRL